jgi:hypothetical protein
MRSEYDFNCDGDGDEYGDNDEYNESEYYDYDDKDNKVLVILFCLCVYIPL